MIVADRVETRNQEVFIEREDDFLPWTAPSPSQVLALSEPPLPFQEAGFRLPTPDVADAETPVRMLDYSWQEPLTRQVADWLQLFVTEGQVVEIRALNVATSNGAKVTYSGFYSWDKLDKMAEAALYLTPEAEGVYFTLNPLDDSLLARRYNKVEPARDTASDADVIRRRWLLVDADPVRKSGISASNEEKQQAWRTVQKVYRWLQGREWHEPVLADSGNGYHMLYRIDLPCADGGLVKSVLEALATQFDSDRVKIDTKVFNPSRIVKLYGTVARKGDSIRERPHRWAAILAVPPERGIVPKELLEQVASSSPAFEPPTTKPARLDMPVQECGSILSRARGYLDKMPGAIAGDKGHNRTYTAANVLIRGFGLSVPEALPVLKEWNQKCEPPWTDKELLHKLEDAEREDGGRGYLLGPSGVGKPNVASGFQTDFIDSAAFDGLTIQHEWLIRKVLVA